MEGYELLYADRPPTRRELAPGLSADLPMLVVAHGVDGGYDVTFELDVTDEGVRPVEVRVRAREGAPPVSGGVLRALRVAELSQGALEYVIHASGETLPGLPDPDLVREARDVGPTDRVLEQVARSYRVAQLVGHPTSKYLQARFGGAPKSTVGNWVRLARERGYLDPVESDRGDG